MWGLGVQKIRLLSVVSVGALMSCGAPPDDASNIPISGKWSDEGKLMAVTLGGTSMDVAQIPELAGLKEKLNQKKEFCGEPRFLTKEEFQAEIDKNNPAGCEIESVAASGDGVKAKGVCKALQLPGVEGQALMEGEARSKPDKFVYDLTINVVVRDPKTGAGEKVTLEAQRTLTRLGNC
jgi:hypothetical protein